MRARDQFLAGAVLAVGSARGRWSAPPSPPARAAGASPGSRRPSCGARSTLRAQGAVLGLEQRAAAARCAPPARVLSSDSGFSTKSKAPILMARTADSMLPWPEMTTTCASTCRSRSRCSVVEAVHARQPDVEQDHVEGLARRPARDRPRRSHRLDVVAFVAQHAAQASCARPARRRRSESRPCRSLNTGSSMVKRVPGGSVVGRRRCCRRARR